MQHFLSSQQGQDIPVKHLYVEYRHWLERAKPFADVQTELATLARQGSHFRRIIAPQVDDVTYPLCSFLERFDIRTAYPLLLALMEAEPYHSEWEAIANILESYLVRRAVCNLGTKNYNRVFLGLTRNLRKEGFSAQALKQLLLAQTGESASWPADAVFGEAWLRRTLYGPLNSPKLVHIYTRLNQSFMSSKSEDVAFGKPPTIEHIMPQDWVANWPLQCGSKGMDAFELFEASENDPRALATRKRDQILQTLGNLTILSSGLNTSQLNLSWPEKRPKLMQHSLLTINQGLGSLEVWDEASIISRANALLERALNIWPR